MKSLILAGLSGALVMTSSYGENLLENASFEQPKIKGRTPSGEKSNPAITEKTTWTALVADPVPKEQGALSIGLTDEIAHTGKQSVFVDFAKVSAQRKRGILTSDIFPVKSEQQYRVSIWGRLDRKRPLSMDQRRPHLRLEVEFFAVDQVTQLGEVESRIQIIPGSVIPGLGTRIFFTSNKWSEYSDQFKAPEQAAFMKISYFIETPNADGETDGIIFFDDAVVDGERGTTPVRELEEVPDPVEPAAAAPKDGKMEAPQVPGPGKNQ